MQGRCCYSVLTLVRQNYARQIEKQNSHNPSSGFWFNVSVKLIQQNKNNKSIHIVHSTYMYMKWWQRKHLKQSLTYCSSMLPSLEELWMLINTKKNNLNNVWVILRVKSDQSLVRPAYVLLLVYAFFSSRFKVDPNADSWEKKASFI